MRDAIVAEGCYLDRCTIEESVVGIRTTIQPGAAIRRSVLLGADFYEADDDAPARGDGPRLGIGRDVVLDRVIVDKNARIGDGARLVNEAGIAARRRRRLLHPQRHHHRAEGRRHHRRNGGLNSGKFRGSKDKASRQVRRRRTSALTPSLCASSRLCTSLS